MDDSAQRPGEGRAAERAGGVDRAAGGADCGAGRVALPAAEDLEEFADAPDETIKRRATTCPHCAADVSGQTQSCRHRYDYIDIPPITPVVTRIELFGGRCSCCGRRFRASAPAGMAPGSPFGASIRSLLLYLHHSHHVGFERLSRMMAELFGLAISEGAIANAFRRAGGVDDGCLRGDQGDAAGRPGHRFGRDDQPDRRRHPLALGVRLGQSRAAPNRATPGKDRCRRRAG
jgi:transposase